MFPVEGETSTKRGSEGGKSLSIRATGAHVNVIRVFVCVCVSVCVSVFVCVFVCVIDRGVKHKKKKC